MCSILPTIRKIVSPEEAARVIEAAKADNDSMVFPSHVVEKKGEIAGAWSIASIPLVLCWHKSDTITARESLLLRNTVDSILDSSGVTRYVTACNSSSPYINHMEKFGFEPIWPTNLFQKNVCS